MGIPLNTLYNWLAKYRCGGLHALKDKAKSGRPKKLNGKVMKWLYDAITMGAPRQYQFEFCLWDLKIIGQILRKEHGIELSKSSVNRLPKKMGFSAPRPISQAYQQDPEKVKNWLQMRYPGIFAEAKEQKATLHFYDEAFFRPNSHSGTALGKIGKPPVAKKHRRRLGINFISAINTRGKMRFKCFEDRMNAESFIEFLECLRKDHKHPIYMVTDGSRHHTAKTVKAYIESCKGEVRLFKLPPYSPELNPDEQV